MLSSFATTTTTATTPAAIAAGTSQAGVDDAAVCPAPAPVDWEPGDAGAGWAWATCAGLCDGFAAGVCAGALLCAKSEPDATSEDSRTATFKVLRI